MSEFGFIASVGNKHFMRKDSEYDCWHVSARTKESDLQLQSDIYDWAYDNSTMHGDRNPQLINGIWELRFTCEPKQAMEFKLRFVGE